MLFKFSVRLISWGRTGRGVSISVSSLLSILLERETLLIFSPFPEFFAKISFVFMSWVLFSVSDISDWNSDFLHIWGLSGHWIGSALKLLALHRTMSLTALLMLFRSVLAQVWYWTPHEGCFFLVAELEVDLLYEDRFLLFEVPRSLLPPHEMLLRLTVPPKSYSRKSRAYLKILSSSGWAFKINGFRTMSSSRGVGMFDYEWITTQEL